MIAILIISVVLAFVAAASFAILRTKRSRSNADADLLPPHGARTLFGGADAAHPIPADEDEDAASEDFERELRERASRGDLPAATWHQVPRRLANHPG